VDAENTLQGMPTHLVQMKGVSIPIGSH